MSGLALADAASAPDWVARWLAIAGLAVSIITVVVTVSLWRRDGWKLEVVIIPAASRRNSGEAGCGNLYGPPEHWRADPPSDGWHTEDVTIFRARVINVGRMPCVVSDIALWSRGRRVSDTFRTTRLVPEVSLSRGELPLTLAPTEPVTVTLTANARVTPGPGQYCVRATAGRRRFSSRWTY